MYPALFLLNAIIQRNINAACIIIALQSVTGMNASGLAPQRTEEWGRFAQPRGRQSRHKAHQEQCITNTANGNINNKAETVGNRLRG